MKRTNTFQALFIGLFLLAFFSCQNQFDLSLETTNSNSEFSVSDAEKWVKQKFAEAKVPLRGEILWDLAEKVNMSSPLLTVPILVEDPNEQVLIRRDGKMIESVISTQRIVFFRDIKGKLSGSIVKIESSQINTINTYTGNLYFSDPLTNNMQSVWELKNGEFVNSIDFANTIINARINCEWEMYILACGDACSGTGVLSGGSYLPDPPGGCCWKYRGCGGGPSSAPGQGVVPIPNPTGVAGVPLGGGGGSNGNGIAVLSNSNSANTILSLGTFRMKVSDISKYPRFASLVKELRSYVENNNEIMNSLSSLTGYSRGEILNSLTWNSGPEIKIEDFATEFGKLGSETRRIVGQFKRGADPNSIYMNANWVRGLESANLEETKKATAFLLGVAMLHEFVHLSRFKNELPRNLCNNPSDYNCEAGWYFNTAAFGTLITDQNASQYSYIFFR